MGWDFVQNFYVQKFFSLNGFDCHIGNKSVNYLIIYSLLRDPVSQVPCSGRGARRCRILNLRVWLSLNRRDTIVAIGMTIYIYHLTWYTWKNLMVEGLAMLTLFRKWIAMIIMILKWQKTVLAVNNELPEYQTRYKKDFIMNKQNLELLHMFNKLDVMVY